MKIKKEQQRLCSSIVTALTREPHLSNEELATCVKAPRSTVGYWLNHLVGAGVVVKTPGQHRIKTVNLGRAAKLGYPAKDPSSAAV